MGISEKLKELAKKAQDAVVENEEKINQAVEKVQLTADQKTGGKYHDKLEKAGAQTKAAVQRLKPDEPAADDGSPPAAAHDATAPTPPAAAHDATAPTPPAAAHDATAPTPPPDPPQAGW